MKIPKKLKGAPLAELEAWARKRDAPRKKPERACNKCGRKQLHWERMFHPVNKGPLRLYLVNRKGVIHECHSKFRVRGVVRVSFSKTRIQNEPPADPEDPVESWARELAEE